MFLYDHQYSQYLPQTEKSSSLVNGDSGTLNYLVIIAAMSWLSGKIWERER